MFRYYTYYSIGGYKDLFLGTDQSNEEATYYLPLLPILSEEAQDDPEKKLQVEELAALPAMVYLSDEESCGLPESAKPLFSHAAYKLIYKHGEGEKHLLALRDIPNLSRDEEGRSAPFLFVIMGDTEEDIRRLDKLAVYMANYMKSAQKKIAEMLLMDYDKNGLRFDLAQFNAWCDSIIGKSVEPSMLVTRSGIVSISGEANKVALLVLPGNITKEMAVREQRISTRNIVDVAIAEIVSQDEEIVLPELINELQTEKERYLWIKELLVLVLNYCSSRLQTENLTIKESIEAERKLNKKIRFGLMALVVGLLLILLWIIF